MKCLNQVKEQVLELQRRCWGHNLEESVLSCQCSSKRGSRWAADLNSGKAPDHEWRRTTYVLSTTTTHKARQHHSTPSWLWAEFGPSQKTGWHPGHIWQSLSESESPSVLSDSLRTHGLYSPWNSPGQNTRVGSLFLLQGIFPTQGLNPGLPQSRQIFYQLSHKGSPRILDW